MTIKVENLNKKYDDIVFESINVEFGVGINFLTGKNGVGKTTLFNILYKEDVEYEGSIYAGEDNLKDIDKLEYRSNICSYVIQNDNLFEDLTVIDNINILVGSYNKEYLNELLINLDIQDNLKKKYKKLSGGQKQKIKIIISLLKDTPIMLIDEMENNLDGESIEYLYNHLKALNKILIIVTHNSVDELKELYTINNFSLFEIKDNKISQIVENNFIDQELKVKESIENIQKPTLKTLNKGLRNNKIALVFIIFLSFILFLPVYTNLVQDVGYIWSTNRDSNMYDDDIVEVYPPVLNTTMYNYSSEDWVQITPYYFSDEDKKMLENNKYVEKVVPLARNNFATSYSPHYEENPNEFINPLDYSSIDFAKYDLEEYEKKNPIQSNFEFNISYPTVDKEVAETISPYIPGTFVDEIIYGNLPEDKSNEVMIDVYTAAYFAQEMDLDSLEDLIGKDITFSTFSVEDVDYVGKYECKVSGIYRQSMNVGLNGFIYTAYNEDNFLTKNGQLWRWPKEEAVEETVYELTSAYTETLGLEAPTNEEVKANGGYRYQGFYVKLKDSKDVGEFVKELEEYNPYLYVSSNYSNKHANNFKYLKGTLLKDFIYFSILLIIITIGLFFLFEIYFMNIMNIKDKLQFYGVDSNKFLKVERNKFITILLVEVSILGIFLIFPFILHYGYISWIDFKYLILYIVLVFIMFIISSKKVKRKDKNGEK